MVPPDAGRLLRRLLPLVPRSYLSYSAPLRADVRRTWLLLFARSTSKR